MSSNGIASSFNAWYTLSETSMVGMSKEYIIFAVTAIIAIKPSCAGRVTLVGVVAVDPTTTRARQHAVGAAYG